MQRFISLRRVSGIDYDGQARLLGYFDRFLVEQHLSEPRITRELTERYQTTLARLSPRTRTNRFGVVRQFCTYLAQRDPQSYVPEPMRGPSSQQAHRAHIYSPAEIQALLGAAGRLPPRDSLRPATYRTLIGLLYTTGMRIEEAMGLHLEDFHPDARLLHIREGKFRKARYVPLSPSTDEALTAYLRQRIQVPPGAADSPLLINLRGRRLRHASVYAAWRQVLQQSPLADRRGPRPRLHDWRHTFAVHRLLDWYRDGQDLNARLPWLATYMGHVDIQSTQVYLQATPELIEQVDRRFHSHYRRHVKPHGERS
jgi:integrase